MKRDETSRKIRNVFLVVAVLAVALIFILRSRNADTAEAERKAREEQMLAEAEEQALAEQANSGSHENEISTTTTLQNLTLTEEQQELRADAKAMLSSAYTMMVAVHSEFERYTSDLSSSMVYEGDVLDLKAGFLDAYQPQDIFPQENPERKDTDFFVRASRYADKPVTYSASAEKIDLQSLAQFCDKKCEASEREFEYIVAVNLDNDPELDVWTINERKEIIHRFDDITNQAP